MFISYCWTMLIQDIRWESHGNTILSGPSESGKTSLLDKILRNKDKLFKEGANKRFILYYLSEQPIYEKWAQDGLIAFKSKGTPTIEDFLETVKFYAPSGAIVFFDDLAGEVKTNIRFYREVWLVHSHHLKLCSFLILHNIFTSGLRELSLNTHKFILTHNPRDSLAISTLSKQSFPEKKNFLPSIYKKLAEQPYSYLCLNFHQNTQPILRVTTNWFSERSPFVMVFQEGTPCSSSPYKCLHLISDELFQSLIEKTDTSCADKCGGEVVEAGSKTNIENNYYGGDNGVNPSGPYLPPHNQSSDNGSNDPATMPSPPPPPPPKPPIPPPSSNPETDTTPESMSKPSNSDLPTDAATIQDSINDAYKLGKERRRSRKNVRDKNRRRRDPYKAIERIKKGEKLPPISPPNPAPDVAMDDTPPPADQKVISPSPSQPPPNHHPPPPPFAPKPPSTPPFKPKPPPLPKFTKKEMEILKIKDKQMRERETVYLSSSDDEGDVSIMTPRPRSPSPQTLIPKPKFKMMPSKISIDGDTSKKTKLKKVEPDLPGWLSIYDGMDRPAHLPEDKKKVKPAIRVRKDLYPPADVEMVDAETKPVKGDDKKVKPAIWVRRDLYPPADVEMNDLSTKSKEGDDEAREKVKKKASKVGVAIKKVKPKIKVRKDLYKRGKEGLVEEQNIHKPDINVRKDLYKRGEADLANERNIHSRINVRTDIFKKSSNPDKVSTAENIHDDDDSVEWLSSIFPSPIDYSVKRENVRGVNKARAKLVSKRPNHHDIKFKSLLGKRKSTLMGKKFPPKMKKLNVGEKRKSPNTTDDKKKQKNNHQSFIKLWQISKME